MHHTTYAEAERLVPTPGGLVQRRPAGLVHAAVPHESTTLCGRPTADLVEFGRFHAFHASPERRRCPTCRAIVSGAEG